MSSTMSGYDSSIIRDIIRNYPAEGTANLEFNDGTFSVIILLKKDKPSATLPADIQPYYVSVVDF